MVWLGGQNWSFLPHSQDFAFSTQHPLTHPPAKLQYWVSESELIRPNGGPHLDATCWPIQGGMNPIGTLSMDKREIQKMRQPVI